MRIHDGAYGTLLSHHLHGDETVDDLCVRCPQVVIDAHRAYIEAGAGAIQTNAFLAHLRTTERRRRDLQHAALACAREATALAGVPEIPLVLATVGPAGDEPRAFWRDLELLLDSEVEGVLCETITERAIADAVLTAWADVARGVDGVLLMVGCSVSPSRGPDAWQWVRELAVDADASVQLGLNCCEGPTEGLRPALAALCDERGSAWTMPSAGVPTVETGSTPTWPFADPAAWADALTTLAAELPVDAVGGCCGTTPRSIEALQAR